MTLAPSPHVTIGPFRLLSMLGSGGMGEVWLGEHMTHKVNVALKIMTSDRARKPEFAERFEREVEVMARMNHPGAAMVLDMGVLEETVEPFSANAPFIVMEYIEGCTLKEAIGKLDWPLTRRILLDLLDTLAHAHAMGVIHRDLKPQNILLEGGVEHMRAAKLVDFGIAHLLDLPSPAEASIDLKPGQVGITGTPKFMSPEQIRMLDHKQGPWTDLYSLGCLAWYMLCGDAPFSGSHMSVLYKHMREDPGEFKPTYSVPVALERWLRKLLAKDPKDRFQRAADAAHALHKLPATTEADLEVMHLKETTEMNALVLNDTTLEIPALSEALLQDVARAERATGEGAPAKSAPPLPPTWHNLWKKPGMKLIGAGLGLWGMRTLPVVGRIAERTLLWETLRTVHDLGQARAVMLEGLSGMGKTKLTEWLLTRAHEVGAAHTLRATHGPMGGPLDGLGPMLGRHLRCQGLDRQEVFSRILQYNEEQALEMDDVVRESAALTELISPRRILSEETGPAHRFSSAMERYAVAASYLEKLCAERTVVLCLDDVQWSLEALGFVRYILTQETRNLPILILMTARAEAVAKLPHIVHVFEQFEKLENFKAHELGPLDKGHQRELLENLLSLRPEVADTVLELTGGTPLFAVQLVDDWVVRGKLKVTDTGFAIDRARAQELPTDFSELIDQRLAYLLGEFPDGTLLALELAATLGRAVAQDEWEELCQRARCEVPEGLVGAMIKANLATREENGWQFAHDKILDVLVASAKFHDRWLRHNGSVAEMVLARHPRNERGAAMRRAEHLIAAELWEESLDALMTALYMAVDFGHYERIDSIISAYEQCMAELELPEEHPIRIRHWCLKSASMRLEGLHEQAHELLDDAIAISRAHQWPGELALALRFKGLLLAAQGAHSNAVTLFEEAIELFEQTEQLEYQARTLGALGQCLSWLSQPEQGAKTHLRALEIFEKIGNEALVGRSHELLVSCMYDMGEDEKAIAHAEAALESARKQGNTRLEAATRNELGIIYRAHGDYEQALEQFHKSAQLYEPLSEVNFLVVHHNIGVVALYQQDIARARGHLEPSYERLRELEQRWILPELIASMISLAAAEQNWDAWDGYFAEFDEVSSVETTSHVVAKMMMRAAELALAADERTHARHCLYIALSHYQRLGAMLHVHEIRDILDKMIP
ncbi:MAG: protein kinase [Myxococcota bacterium]|nr:protein kinase [Myxococcota bacterium]